MPENKNEIAVPPQVKLGLENALLICETAGAKLEAARAKLENELTRAAVSAGIDINDPWRYDPAKGAFLRDDPPAAPVPPPTFHPEENK